MFRFQTHVFETVLGSVAFVVGKWLLGPWIHSHILLSPHVWLIVW
jgi:hypothetical protein